ncbi:MAG TPA: hypothetical protein VFC03_06225, partial [Acidimicrobiales bacterium]|nr:hypothetical protein [Acidimicrobiales bacterium]
PGPCGRCSVCTGEMPAQGLNIDADAIEAARVHLRGADVIIEPRKLWPSGLNDGRKGRIDGASAGRALTFADSPGWRDAARAIAGPDRPLDDDVVRGMVSVLSRWRESWEQRPVGVVPMPSRHHATMVGDLAAKIAEIGKLPLIDALDARGPRPPADVPSAPKVNALLARLVLRDGAELPGNGPVLLIDDSYRTGWTMTVAAALLREAGAAGVMPLVVHQLP